MKNLYLLIFVVLSTFVSLGQFVKNNGQVVDSDGELRSDVNFTYQSNGAKLFFFKNKITYVLFETFHEETKESKKAREEGDTKKADNISLRIKQQHVEFNFLNSNSDVKIIYQDKKLDYQNFYLAHCPKGITNVPVFSKITYTNIYDNIDIIFKSTKKGVKYDIILHPGANIDDIQFEYDGVKNIQFKKDKIIFETEIQNLEENIPLSFIAESGEPIDIHYKDLKNGVFGFESETDFKNKKVIIDPVLTWATYFEQTVSPNASYIGQNTHVDASGNFYFQIGTYNADLPSQNPGVPAYIDPSHTGGGIETYFAQFDANRNLIWSTYLGGSGTESNYYDHGLGSYGGSFFIAGRTTSTDFPVMNQGAGAFYQGTRTTGTNAFFSKFNASTGAMEHSTYLGYITQIVMDVSSSGNLVIVGVAGSSSDAGTLLVQSRAGAYNQATLAGNNDVFVAQFNASTCVKNWGTFVGGADWEEPMGVTFDNSNNLFLFNRAIGSTTPTVNPGGGAYYNNTSGGSYDNWFVKFNSSGSMVWSTLYGGAGLEGLSYSKITVTPNNHIVATTSTRSTAMPTTNPGGGAYFQSAPAYLTNGNGGDPGTGFMVRFNNSGVVQHATYMGHPTNGNGTTKGNIPGASNSHYFLLSMPTSPVYPVSCAGPDYCSSYTAGSSTTGYIMELDASYNMTWDSYLYSADRVFGESMTSDVSRSRVYVTGSSDNSASPTVDPGGGAYYDNTLNGTTRAYNIMEFSACVSETNTTPTTSICENATKALTSSGAGGGTWSIVSGGGSISGTTYTPADISVATSVTVRYVDGCGTGTNRTFTVNPLPATPSIPTGPATVCSGVATTGYAVAAAANATSYQWAYSGTGTVTPTGSPSGITATLNATTGGSLTVRAVNACGNSAYSSGLAITVNSTPAVPSAPTGPSSVCPSVLTTGYAVSAVAGATSYQWTYSGTGTVTPTGSPSGITASLNATVGGNLRVRAVNSCGTSAYGATYAVAVSASGPAVPSAPTGPSAVCASTLTAGYSVAAVAGATSYDWDYTGTGTVTETGSPTGISATLNATAGGNLRVRAVNSCGASAYGSVLAITIDGAIPASPGAPSGPSAVCASTLTAGYSVAAVSGATSYDWDYTGTGTVTETGSPSGITASLNATAGGNLRVRSVNACGSSAYGSVLAVTVDGAIPASPGAPSGPGAVCTSTLTAGYSVAAVAGATSYDWNYTGTGTVTETGSPSGISATLNATAGGNLSVRSVNACGSSAYGSVLAVTVDGAIPASPGAPSGPSAVCTSTLTAGYSVAAVAGATSYDWDYTGTGTVTETGSPSGITASLNATSGGNLRVRAINSCGTSAYGPVLAVTIDGAIPASPSAPSGPSAVCSATPTTGYSIGAVAGATSYNWSYSGTGTVTETGSPLGISATLNATTAGNLTVQAVNACGSSSASAVLAVTVDAATPATPGAITGPTSVCRGASPLYSISAVTNATSYTWNYTGTGTATSSTTSVTFSPTTNGLLSVTASNACGTSSANSIALTIDTTFTPSIVSSGFDMCTGDSRTLVGSPVGGTFSVVSGGAFGSVVGNTLNANAVGTVQIRYRITNACGNMDVLQSINIVSPSVATITSSTAAMCIGDLRGLTATPLGGSFSVIAGPGYIGLNDTLTPTNSGLVQVQYQYISPCGVTADTVSITVNPEPTVTITSASTDMCIGGTRALTGTPGGGMWNLVSGPGSILGSTLTTSGAGIIQLEYTASALGCPGTTSQTISVVGSSDATWTSPGNLCETAGLVDLTSYLAGPSTPGGVWSGSPSVSSGGILNTAGLGGTTINVKYKVGTNPCKDSLTLAITITTSPIATWDMPSTICENEQFDLDTLLSLGSTTGGNWSILSGGGSLLGSVYTPANVVANTSASIRYSIPAASGCPTVNYDETFTVNLEEIAVNTTSTADICENSTKTLVGSPAGGTWTVVSGGGGISGTTYTPGNVTANTPVVVRYTIASNGACPATTADVSFNVNVEEIANNTTSTADICESSTKALTATPAGGSWSVVSGGGSIVGTTYTPANVTANTAVTVRYTIAANGGCPATTSDVAFTVNVEEIANNTTTTTGICENTTKALIATPAGGVWSVVSGGGSIAGTTYTPANVTANTSVVVRYTIPTNGGCVATTSDVTFNVNVEEIANNLTSTADICESSTKTLLASPAGGTWSVVSGGGTIAGTTYTPANVTANTAVTVRYTIAANGGCPATTSDVVFNVNLEEIANNTTTTTAICEGLTKSLTGTPAGGLWSVVSGGGSITGSTYTASTVNNDTLVTVRYTIPTNGGCVATTSDVSFTVTDNVLANNLTSTADICESSTKMLLASPAGGSWSVVSGGGTIAGTTYTPANVTANTVVTIRYTVAATGGCPASTSDVVFTVNEEEIANNTTTTGSICETDTKALTATPAGGLWSVVSGGGTIVGTTYTPANITSNTLVTVRYTIAANGGCSASISDVSFDVFTDLGIAVNSTTTDTICESGTKNLVGTPIGGSWSVVSGGGTIVGATYTPASITSDVDVTVRYTMPTNGSCPATTSDVTFTVNADVPVAVNTTTTDAICSSEIKTLVGSPAGGVWSVVSGSGTISGTTYTPIAVASPINVTVRYEFTNGKCNSYEDITFTVNNVSATPSISAVANDSVCINELVILNATVGGTGNSVHWFTNNTASGIPLAIGNTLTDNPTANTTYYAFGYSGQLCESISYDSVNIYTYAPSVSASSITATLDTVCSGQNTTLTLSGGSLGKNAVWTWYETTCGNSTSIGTGLSVTVSPLASESYYVRAEGLCDTTVCAQFDVVVQNSVDASWTAPDSICVDAGLINLNQYLDATTTTGGVWTGIGVTDSILDPQVNGLGTVNITYTVGVSPCVDMQSQTITIYNAQPASISDDNISVTTGSTEILDVESNDVTSGIISISVLAQHGIAYVNNNRIVYIADSSHRGYDTIEYSVCDNSCSNTCDTAQVILRIEKNVFDNPDNGNIGIWGVSPNQDGINDVLYIDDLYNHPNNKITIYNRWGDEIFTTSPYVNDWAGNEFTMGHYFFVLEFLDTEETFKGIIYLKK